MALSEDDIHDLALKLDRDCFDMGPISILVRDPSVTEIMINDFDEVYSERDGKLVRESASFRNSSHVKNIIDKVLGPLGLRVDECNPMVDARLNDGSRINIVINPVCSKDIVVTIRKFKDDMKNMEQLIGAGSLDSKVGQFLSDCVRKKVNILISGGTGTGKTTLLNILSGSIAKGERIITIEETLELRFTHQNLVRLEARFPNIEGEGEITIRDLVRNALRMRPSRIIVGEIRGSEAVDVLQAMNTGHSGSMTTVHANSTRDVLSRLETMVLMAGMDLPVKAIREQVASAVDLIVHMNRLKDGTRRFIKITEVQGMEGDVITLQDLFSFDFSEGFDEEGKFKGHIKATGLIPKFNYKLRDIGIDVPVEIFGKEI